MKILGAGSVATFAAVGCYVWLVAPGMSVAAVKFSVDAGVLLAVLLSIAIRRPFTLQYALEAVDAETAGSPASSVPTTSSPGRGPPRCWR